MRISDWSSDVCSSDLIEYAGASLPIAGYDEGTYRQNVEELQDIDYGLSSLGKSIAISEAFAHMDGIVGQLQNADVIDPPAQVYLGEIIEDIRVEADHIIIDFRRNEIGRASCRESVCQYV